MKGTNTLWSNGPIEANVGNQIVESTDFGHTLDPGASSEVQKTILRLIPRVRAELSQNFMKKLLSMQDVSIYADNVYYYLPIEDQKTTHNYLVAGITFMISDNLGLNFEY